MRSRISDAFEKIRGVNFAREELQMFRYNRFNTAVVFATEHFQIVAAMYVTVLKWCFAYRQQVE